MHSFCLVFFINLSVICLKNVLIYCYSTSDLYFDSNFDFDFDSDSDFDCDLNFDFDYNFDLDLDFDNCWNGYSLLYVFGIL